MIVGCARTCESPISDQPSMGTLGLLIDQPPRYRIQHLPMIAIFLSALLSLCVAVPARAQRTFFGSKLDVDGWTILTRSADTHVIYVSNSAGSDKNNGLSQSSPVKTIAKGLSRLRNGYPDWLLLKKGDIWTNEEFGILPVHGRSPVEPLVISSYGTGARPLIQTAGNLSGEAIGTQRNNANGDFVALIGLDFYAYTRDPSNPSFSLSGLHQQQIGFGFLNKINWFLMEDCKFSFYNGNAISYPNVSTGGMSNNVILRRNVIVDSYNPQIHSQGLYVDNIINLVLEENLFDHNGWNSMVSGAGANVFNHNIYINATSGQAILKGNIIARAASNGYQLRAGGVVEDNLLVANPIAGFVAGAKSLVRNNVVMEGSDIDISNPRGWGLQVVSGDGSLLEGNVIAHVTSADPPGSIIIESHSTNTIVKNNIEYLWGPGPPSIMDKGTATVVSGNQDNLMASSYPDPNRSLASYHATLGGAPTTDAFLVEARKQGKDNWRTAYTAKAVNAYIRAGFGR
jgi:hypothetical protein